MTDGTLQRIRQASPAIRDRWEQLLRHARPTTPVSNPEGMVARIPESLAQIIRALSWHSIHGAPRRRPQPARRCAHNPFRAYFRAGERAILESIAIPGAPAHPHDPLPSGAGAAPGSALPCCSDASAPAVGSAGEPVAARTGDAVALRRAIDALSSADMDAFCAVCRRYRLLTVCRYGRDD